MWSYSSRVPHISLQLGNVGFPKYAHRVPPISPVLGNVGFSKRLLSSLCRAYFQRLYNVIPKLFSIPGWRPGLTSQPLLRSSILASHESRRYAEMLGS